MTDVLATTRTLAEAISEIEAHIKQLPVFQSTSQKTAFWASLSKQEHAKLNVAVAYACYALIWSMSCRG
jgi:hypothetical protein